MARKKKNNVQIFKLEERVLFDGAAAADIVAAVNNAGNDAQTDQDSDDNSQDEEEKLIQNTVKNAGPVDTPAPETNVQNDGEGLPQSDAAQNDPADVLIQGNADFSQVSDADAPFSGDVAEFIQTASRPDAAEAADHELIVIDSEAADQFDQDAFEGKNVIFLDRDSDAADQIQDWMNEHSDQDINEVRLVTDSDTLASRIGDIDADVVSVEAFQAELNDVSDNMLVIPDHDANITVEAQTGVLPEELTNDAEAGRHELVIINSNIAEIDNVLEQLGDSRDVLVIDIHADAFEQISEYLNNSDTAYDAVHILTHGNEQGFYLGHQKVDAADQMAVFDGHMAEHGDFMLYGCNLAASENGQALIHNIADYTGCDVAASANITGAESLGGDWTLEYSTGAIETTSISLDSGWDHRLAAVSITVDSDATETETSVKTFAKALTLANGAKDDDTVSIEIKKTADSDHGPGANFTFTTKAPVTIQTATPTSETETITFNWQVAGVTINNGASVTIAGNITLTNEPGGNIYVMGGGTLELSNTSNDVQITLNSTGHLSLGPTTVSTVTAADNADITMVSASTISNLTLQSGSTPWSFSNGKVTSLNNYHSNVAGQGTTWGTVTNTGGFTLSNGSISQMNNTGGGSFSMSGGTVGTLNHSAGTLTITNGKVTTLNASYDLTISGYAQVATANLSGGDIDINGGTINTMTAAVNTLDITAGTISDLTLNSGILNGTGGKITILHNASSDSGNLLNGTTIESILQNSGNITINSGTVKALQNDSGTVTFTGGSVSETVTNAAGAAIAINASITTGHFTNEGTVNINNATLGIATGNGETAFVNRSTGSVVFNNGILSNTTPTNGIGISNTDGGSITATGATATIQGFVFATELANVNSVTQSAGVYTIDFTDGSSPISFTDGGNTYAALVALTVRGSNTAIPGVEKMDDALSAVYNATSGTFYSISINLDLSEYSKWNDYLTVEGDYSAKSFTNLFKISSTTNVGSYVQQNVLLNSSLTLEPLGNGGTITFENVSFTMQSANSALTIESGSNLLLTGTGKEIVSVYGEGTPYQSATLKNGAASLVNNGTLNIAGSVTGQYENLATKLQTVVNNNQLNLTGRFSLSVAAYALSNAPEVDGIYNSATGTLTVTGTTPIPHQTALSGTIPTHISTSALVRNEGTAKFSHSTLTLTSTSGNNAYAIYNDGVLEISDSFVDASGTKSYGLFNGVNGDALFAVNTLPDITVFSGSGSVLDLYTSQIYHIKGSAYSVYNQGKFVAKNNITSPLVVNGLLTGELVNSLSATVTFQDAPVYALIGNFQTMASADGTAETRLNDITLVGDFLSEGTAKNNLDNLILNGNLYNTVSEVYVSGNFMPSNFRFGLKGGTPSVYAGSAITVYNLMSDTEGTRKGGAVYFGQSDMVYFNSQADYAFYNYSGEMLFQYFTGLSSEEHPAQFYNQGVMLIDGTTTPAGQAGNLYQLYVKATPNSEHVAVGVSDRGIQNEYANVYNVASVVKNQLTLKGLDIRNTQNNSVAVTNYAGNLTIEGGKLSATYSGLDNLEQHYSVYKTSGYYEFYVITGIANLNNIEEIAGSAYSVRNIGELNITGPAGYTLFTNKLNFSSSYTGDYTAVLNSSISVALWEHDPTVDNVAYNIPHYIWNSAFSYGSLTLPQRKGSSVLASSHLYHITSVSTVKRDEITLTLAGSYAPSGGGFTDYYYDPVVVAVSTAALDKAAFLAGSTPAVNTVFSNWGTLTATGIEAQTYKFNGFNYMLDVSTSYFATYSTQGGVTLTITVLTTQSDIEVGFEVSASSIKSATVPWEITMRGVKVNPGDPTDYYYTGNFKVNGSALAVSTYGELSLINFSVNAVNAANAIQVDVGGLLHVYNGVYDDATHQWIGGSSAVISSDGNANGVMLYGTMELINGAITECVNGIVASDTAGLLLVINSTIAGNSGWGVISNIAAPSDTSKHNLFVADSTIAYNGAGGIQVNNGGKLSMLNSIVLNRNTAGTGSVDIVLNDGSTRAEGFEGNVFGSSASDTDAKMKNVFDFLALNWTGPDMYTISQVKGNDYAWNASIQWSFNANGSNHLFLSEIVLGGGGDYSITYDKMGNARQASGDRIGSYVLSGSVGPTTILVNTLQDSDSILPGTGGTKLYSLRYVINYLLGGDNLAADTVVGFDWNALYKESGENPNLTITLDASRYSSLDVSYVSGVSLITSLTIDLSAASGQEIPSGYTLNIDGNTLTSSTFIVSGIALTINGAGALTVTGSANSAADGAAFNLADVAGTSLNLANATVAGGYTIGNGGAVYIGGSNAAMTADGVTFSGNHADGDGGAVYNNGGTLTVSNSVFSTNTASLNGGAVYNNGGTLTVSNSVFSGNNSVQDGGAVYNAGMLTVIGTTFTGNNAGWDGGAVYNNGGTLSLSGSTFSNNTAAFDGGAVYNNGGTVTAENTTFSGNHADGNGGAVYNGGTLTASNTDFSGNTADGNGGALFNWGTAVINGNVTGNQAVDGAGIYNNSGSVTLTGNLSNNTASGNGGGIFNAGSDVTIQGNVEGNQAMSGAAVYSVGGAVKLTGNLVNNTASAGSVVYIADGSFDMVGDITGNSGTGIIEADGGLIQIGDLSHYIWISGNNGSLTLANGGDILIVNAAVRNNNAGSAALFDVNGGKLTLLNSTVTANTGDILTETAGTVQFADSTIAFNTGSQILVTGGSLYAVNSIVNAANAFTVTNQAGSLINVNEADVFSMKNGKPIEGKNGTLAIKLAGAAGLGGVLVGYSRSASGTSVYYTSDGAAWYDVSGAAAAAPAVQITVAQNEANRIYSGYGRLSIGAFSLREETLSLVVTISGDETQEGETTLRDALEYADYLYITKGEVQTVTFKVKDVYLNSTITIRNPVVVDGGGSVTVHTADLGPGSLFIGDSVFIVDSSTNAVTFKGITVEGKSGVRGFRVDSGNLHLANVTVRNGQANGLVPGSLARGGAVYVKNGGALTGWNVTLKDNFAAEGGAIYAEGPVTLDGFTVKGNQTSDNTSAIIQVNRPDVSSVLFLKNGQLSGNQSAGMLIATTGTAELVTVTAYGNTIGSSLLTANSADVVNSTLTGDPANGMPLVQITSDLNVVNSVIVTSDPNSQAAFAGTIASAYSIYSGWLDNVDVNVYNLTGMSYSDVFTGNLPVPSPDSPAAVGVWTTYDPATRTIAYSERPEGIWTVKYTPENMSWRYLGGGAAPYQPSLLVGGTNMPSIGSMWAPGGWNHPDYGPGVNTTQINPSYKGGPIFGGWGYNSVVNSYLMNPGSSLYGLDESGMGWYAALLSELFGIKTQQTSVLSVTGGIPNEELDLSVDASEQDFEEFQEAPYHAEDGTPLNQAELNAIRTAAITGRLPEDSVHLDDAVHSQVASSLRSAELFKDSFDKALDALLGLDA